MIPARRYLFNLVVTKLIMIIFVMPSGKTQSDGRRQPEPATTPQSSQGTSESPQRTEAAVREYRHHCARCHGDDYTGAEGTSESPQRTEAAVREYRHHCARCHGDDYTGAEGRRHTKEIPDFTSDSWQESRTNSQLRSSIRDGKGARMPPFGDKLEDKQVRNLIALIRNANSKRSRAAGPTSKNFEERFMELQAELDSLRKEFRKLADSD
jgi:mono/diheme cytochrome c family protein